MSSTYKQVSLGAAALYPTSIDTDEQPIEDSERMADGTLRVWHIAYKGRWTLRWSGLGEDAVQGIRGLYRAGGSRTYTDEFGTAYTVRLRGFRAALSAAFIGYRDGIIRYDVTLELEEI